MFLPPEAGHKQRESIPQEQKYREMRERIEKREEREAQKWQRERIARLKEKGMLGMKENVYDEQINPLMAQIIAICKQHKISLIADFGLDDDLHCTSALLTEEYSPSDEQIRAWQILKPDEGFAIAETIETKPDGSKRITMRRIS